MEGTLVLAGDDDITGNNYSDVLRSASGNDVLRGQGGNDVLDGGTGVDTMVGGTGNDTYVVDNAGDVVRETSTLATETDTVQSSISYTLGANVENLKLMGSAALNGTGNALRNALTGNAAANLLNGGAGADTLVGGAGNDTYVVDNAGDVVRETSTLATEIDTVQSSVSYTLGAQVENLQLMGSAALTGTGNALRNVLTGNAAANVLNGGDGADVLMGGGAADRLTGGGGNDTFRFTAWSDLGLDANRDVIADFVRGQDKIDLSAIDANAALAGNQAFAFLTTDAPFTPGQVRYANGVVSINTDTDAAAEYQIRLLGTLSTPLTAADFVL